MHRDNFKNDLYISGIGQILVIILAFLLNKILSIVLGPVGYSEYSLINKTSAVLSFIMAMSLGIAVPKYLAISRVSWDYSEEFAYFSSAVLIMSIANIIVICVLLLFPDFFMRLLFNSFDNNYLYPLIVFSCGTSIVTVTSSYYRGLDKYISFSAIQIIASFIGVLPIIWISKESDHILRYAA
jgi:O-antigen/teichoic acid export membrane protein